MNYDCSDEESLSISDDNLNRNPLPVAKCSGNKYYYNMYLYLFHLNKTQISLDN